MDRAPEILDKHLGMLAEHFTSVQIVATQLLPDGNTKLYTRGSGDWFARRGACQE